MAIQQMLLRTYTPQVRVETNTYGAGAISPADATITFTLTNTGDANTSVNAAPTVVQYKWLLLGAAAAFEVRASLVSGAVTAGTTGTWLALSTSRSWTVSRTSNIAGVDEAVLTVEIREAVSGTVRASGTVTLQAAVDI